MIGLNPLLRRRGALFPGRRWRSRSWRPCQAGCAAPVSAAVAVRGGRAVPRQSCTWCTAGPRCTEAGSAPHAVPSGDPRPRPEERERSRRGASPAADAPGPTLPSSSGEASRRKSGGRRRRPGGGHRRRSLPADDRGRRPRPPPFRSRRGDDVSAVPRLGNHRFRRCGGRATFWRRSACGDAISAPLPRPARNFPRLQPRNLLATQFYGFAPDLILAGGP